VIRGVVTATGVPTITLTIAGRDWAATIDTGFNGDLELPASLRSSVNARYFGRVTATLAAGLSVTEEVYIVDFPFDGVELQAEATFVDSNQLLIGTHLLQNYLLRIDFVHGIVELERQQN